VSYLSAPPLLKKNKPRISWSGIAATKEKANRSGAERAQKTQRFGTRKNAGGWHELLLPPKGAPRRGEAQAKTAAKARAIHSPTLRRRQNPRSSVLGAAAVRSFLVAAVPLQKTHGRFSRSLFLELGGVISFAEAGVGILLDHAHLDPAIFSVFFRVARHVADVVLAAEFLINLPE